MKALSAMPDAGLWAGRQSPPMPILGQSRGSVRFTYGARTQSFGFGLDSSKPSGRGLDNMKNRAAKLHGAVEFLVLKGGGTCVNLYLPLAKMV